MNCKSEAIIAAQEVLDAIKTRIDEVQKELDEANETLAQRAPVEQAQKPLDK